MHKIVVILVAALAFLSPWSGAEAQQPPDRTTRVLRDTALVLDSVGSAQWRKGDTGDFKKLNVGDLLPSQSTVKTTDNAAVLLKFNGGHLFRIGEKSTVVLKELGVDKAFSFQVIAGNIWSVVRKVNQPAKYEVETPSVVAGVSGTIFEVSHDPDANTSSVSTNLGQVDVQQFDDQHNRLAEKAHVGGGQFLELHRDRSFSVKGTGSSPPGPAHSVPSMAVRAQPPAYRQMWQTMRQQEPMFQPMARPTQFKLSPKIESAVRPTLFRRNGPGPAGSRPGPNGGVRPGAGPGGRGQGGGMPGNNRPGPNNGVNRPGMNRPGLNGGGPNRTGINHSGPAGTGINRPGINHPGVNGNGVNRPGMNRPGLHGTAGEKGAGSGKPAGKPGAGKPGDTKHGAGVTNGGKPGSQKPGNHPESKPGAKKPPLHKPGGKTPPDHKHDTVTPGEKSGKDPKEGK